MPAAAERPWRDGMQHGDPAAPATAISPYNTANVMQDSPYGMQSDPYGQPMYGRPMYGSSPYSNSYPAAQYGSSYGGYGAGGMYGSSYGGNMYNNSSMYGSSMYGSAFRGGMGGYGAGGYGMGAYGGGGYGTGGYGGVGGYGGAGYGGYGAGGIPPGMPPQGQQLPGPPGQPGNLLEGAKSKWQVFMQSLHNLMHFFGRVSFLMDENAHAVHFFITALLQMLDRASFLWGEVARFVLRMLGYKLPLGRSDSAADLTKPADAKASDAAAAVSPVAALESAWSGK